MRNKNIEKAREYIALIREASGNLHDKYIDGRLSYQDYFFSLSKLLKGKTEKQWIEYYSNYIKFARKGIPLPALEKPNLPEKSIAWKLAVPLLILLLSMTAILFNEYTGLVVLGNESANIYPLDISANISSNYSITLPYNPASIRLSGSITGKGTLKAYLLSNNLSLLIADSAYLAETMNIVYANISANQTELQTGQTLVFKEICIETCSLAGIPNEFMLMAIISDSTIKLSNLSYTVALPGLFATPSTTPIEKPTLSSKNIFQLSESPEFKLEYNKEELGIGISSQEKQIGSWQTDQETIDVKVYDSKGNLATLPVEIKEVLPGKFIISLLPVREIRPGRYKAVIELTAGQETFSIEQEFLWGVLAINTNKPSYLENENAFIAMAVLDNEGKVVCDADLTLDITDPSDSTTILTTSNKEILVSPECTTLGVTKLPDYYTNYQASTPGIYSMRLKAVQNSTTNIIVSNFSVNSSLDFDIERIGPTRIFPPARYMMNITIKANKQYSGLITERVPSSFAITPQPGMSISTIGDTKTLSWNAQLSPGDKRSLHYEFDAPDISPYLFVLGKVSMANYSEFRYWQIASDAGGTVQDLNLTGSLLKNTNIIITKNGKINGYLFWDQQTFNGKVDIRIFLEYNKNTTIGDNSDSGTGMQATCGTRAFMIVNTTPNDVDACSGNGHGCFNDKAFKSGGDAAKINISTESAVTSKKYTFGIDSCNISGVFDIGADRTLVGAEGGATLNNWFNVTVATTLFIHPNPSNASRRLYYANKTNPSYNESVNLSVRITNEADVIYSVFSTNLTGTWKNRSFYQYTGATDTNVVNWTVIRTNFSSLKAIGWRYFANDSSTIPNASSINLLIPDDRRPFFTNITNDNRNTYTINTTSPVANQFVNMSLVIRDTIDISHYIFSWNDTGIWANNTWVKLSGTQITYANWTRRQVTAAAGKIVGWRFYANDSFGQLNKSSTNTFTVTSAPTTKTTTSVSSGGGGKAFGHGDIPTTIASSTISSTVTSAETSIDTTIIAEIAKPSPPEPGSVNRLIATIASFVNTSLAKRLSFVLEIILIILISFELIKYRLGNRIGKRLVLFAASVVLIFAAANSSLLPSPAFAIAINLIGLIVYLALRLLR